MDKEDLKLKFKLKILPNHELQERLALAIMKIEKNSRIKFEIDQKYRSFMTLTTEHSGAIFRAYNQFCLYNTECYNLKSGSPVEAYFEYKGEVLENVFDGLHWLDSEAVYGKRGMLVQNEEVIEYNREHFHEDEVYFVAIKKDDNSFYFKEASLLKGKSLTRDLTSIFSQGLKESIFLRSCLNKEIG